MMTSSAGRSCSEWVSTGIPRPSSGDGHRVVVVNRDVDGVAIARQRLVDRVVDYFVDEMVQTLDSVVEPMYIAGRFWTACNPSRT